MGLRKNDCYEQAQKTELEGIVARHMGANSSFN